MGYVNWENTQQKKEFMRLKRQEAMLTNSKDGINTETKKEFGAVMLWVKK